MTKIQYATWHYVQIQSKIGIKYKSWLKHDWNFLSTTSKQPTHFQLSQDTCDHHPFFALVCLTNPGIPGSKFVIISTRTLRAPCWEEVQATHHLRCHRFEQCARPQTLSLSIVRWHKTTRLSLRATSFEFMHKRDVRWVRCITVFVFCVI